MEKRKAPIENSEGQTDEKLWKTDATGNTVLQDEERISALLPHVSGKTYRVIKRCFDFLSSLIVSIIIFIPLLFLMVLIMIKDPGNPLYFQKRVGKGGKPIYVAKLRTMRINSDHLEEMLTADQLKEYKHEYKLKDDPRLIGWKNHGDGVKCFGGILRKYSLDELPQIPYNICIKGNMSVVGPRPILEEELKKNYTQNQQKEILSMKPGLTGCWQTYGRSDATYESGQRQELELYYVRHCSILFDIKLILRTAISVLRAKGSY